VSEAAALYHTRRATMTVAAAILVVRELAAEFRSMDEALKANPADAPDTERITPANEADVRAMRFHLGEAQQAFRRDDYVSARQHIAAANDCYQHLLAALPELEE